LSWRTPPRPRRKGERFSARIGRGRGLLAASALYYLASIHPSA
jgi:hypothetical protein